MDKRLIFVASLVSIPLLAACRGDVALAAEPRASGAQVSVLQRFDVAGTDYKGGMGIATFAPHAEKSRHTHTGPEVCYVLEGEVILIFDSLQQNYKSGESYQIPAGAAHTTKAGPHGAKILATWVLK